MLFLLLQKTVRACLLIHPDLNQYKVCYYRGNFILLLLLLRFDHAPYNVYALTHQSNNKTNSLTSIRKPTAAPELVAALVEASVATPFVLHCVISQQFYTNSCNQPRLHTANDVISTVVKSNGKRSETGRGQTQTRLLMKITPLLLLLLL